MRESTRPHGFMRTGGGRLASLRSIHPQYRVGSKSCDGADDSHVRAMWDEEFFGHDLPPNYVISREGSVDEHHSKRKDSGSNRRDLSELSAGEQAMWDEEFLGHNLPPNYRISRDGNEDLVKRKDLDGMRGPKKPGAGELLSGAVQRHARCVSEETFEYHFDKTIDSYVLCEAKRLGCKNGGAGGALEEVGADGSALAKQDPSRKEETFEERALRFGVEDWNLVGKKWSQADLKGSRPSSRRGIFHSPSGSDTSSLVSTLESSSFSFGSEGSSFAKGDYSATGFNFIPGYSFSTVRIPLSALARQSGGSSEERVPNDGQFVELTLLGKTKADGEGAKPKEGGVEDSSFLEFNFLDGRMVESGDSDSPIVSMSLSPSDRKSSTVSKDEDASSEEFADRSIPTPTVYQSATTHSPDSESFFGSSHDSDWSATRSISTERGPPGCRNGSEAPDFDEDERSSYAEDRGDDWSSDTHFVDADSSTICKPSPSSASDTHVHLYTGVDRVSTMKAQRHGNRPPVPGKSIAGLEKRSSKPNTQVPSRRARSLGSVLSQHLAFTAIPSLRHKAQFGRTNANQKPQCGAQWVDGDSPAKVTAACIEWLWAEKGHMKPVQSLRALAAQERELAARRGITTTVSPSPPVRNLEAAFKESRTSTVLRKINPGAEKGASADTLKVPGRSGASPVRVAWRDPSKESRASILASWSAVYGLNDGSQEKSRSHQTKSGKVVVLPGSPKRALRTGVPAKRVVNGGVQAAAKAGSRLSRHVPKNLALELEVLCRPFGPVLKGVRCLPTSKRGPGRPPYFSQGEHQVSDTSNTAPIVAPERKSGRLQCVLTRDGLPSYSLIMDESEEIFVAKSQRVDAGFHDGVTHLYTFHSYKGKGKGKANWRQWGKKEKPSSDFAGNMKVTSTICPVMSCSGVQNFVESEFVLLDAKIKEMSISGPATSSSYPRSSFSSWDTTPLRSPRLPSSSFSSPSSTYFSLPSPGGVVSTTPESTSGHVPSLTLPSRYVSLSMTSGVTLKALSGLERGTSSLDKGVSRLRQLERHVTLGSPLQYNMKLGNCGFQESWSDSETVDETESKVTLRSGAHSQSELAAVVVRAPMEKEQEKATTAGDKWGWGINFLKKVSGDKSGDGASPGDGARGGDVSPSTDSAACAKANAGANCEAGNPSEGRVCCSDQSCGSCGYTSVDEQLKRGMSITLILPAGNHGCSANGIDGPQPLIERWRSGGKCDCGSWDLGCGLTVISNQRVEPGCKSSNADTASNVTDSQDNTLLLLLQGKKQETVGLTMTALREGCYTIGVQAPISSLHAFATAVAVLHSRDPLNATKKPGEVAKRRTPIKPVKTSSGSTTNNPNFTTAPTIRSFPSRPNDVASSLKPLMNYQLVCPDPPLSPFGRA